MSDGTRIEIYRGDGKHPWYVRIVAANGQTVLISEGYYSKFNAKRAARKMFPLIEPIEVDEP